MLSSRCLSNLWSLSRNHLQRSPRLISSCCNNNVSHENQHLNGHGQRFLNLRSLRAPSTVAPCYQAHFYSTKGGKGNEETEEPAEAEIESPGEFIHSHLPSTVAIPEVWPYLPCIATTRVSLLELVHVHYLVLN